MMPTAFTARDQQGLVPLAEYRDVGGGLTIVVIAILAMALSGILGRWSHFHVSLKPLLGLGFMFGVPGAVATWGALHAWHRERWYISQDGSELTWLRRNWKGEAEERFATGQYIFELSRENGRAGMGYYAALRLTMRSAAGKNRGLTVKYGREKEGDVMTVVSTLRERGVDVLELPGKW